MNSILFTEGKSVPSPYGTAPYVLPHSKACVPGTVLHRNSLIIISPSAAGGVGMTTIAYAAVTQSGLSFERQLWMRPEIVPELRRLTDAIHHEGAAASIQLGHCGNMSHRSICGCMPSVQAVDSTLFPTFVPWTAKR